MGKRVALVAILQVLAGSFHGGANAFSVSQMANARRSTALSASFNDHDGGDSPSDQALRARTCFRNFLTQRSVQSFMFLLISCRDPHTANWLKVREKL